MRMNQGIFKRVSVWVRKSLLWGCLWFTFLCGLGNSYKFHLLTHFSLQAFLLIQREEPETEVEKGRREAKYEWLCRKQYSWWPFSKRLACGHMRCEFMVEELIGQCYLIWNKKKKKESLSFFPGFRCLKALTQVPGWSWKNPTRNLDFGLCQSGDLGSGLFSGGPTVI